MIGVLHTARINAIEFIVSSDKLIKMVNFKLGHQSYTPGHLSYMNSVKWPCSPWVLVAQCIECPPGVREVMGSIPVWDSEFFSVPRSCHVDQFHLSHFITGLSNSPSLFTYQKLCSFVKVEYLYLSSSKLKCGRFLGRLVGSFFAFRFLVLNNFNVYFFNWDFVMPSWWAPVYFTWS